MSITLTSSPSFNQSNGDPISKKTISMPKQVACLPVDICRNVLFYLDHPDIKCMTILSKEWNQFSIKLVEDEAFKSLRKFINSLFNNRVLDGKKEKEFFLRLIDNKKMDSKNLAQIKNSIEEIKKQLCDFLKLLEVQNLQELEECLTSEIKSTPFENIFYLVKIYKTLESAYTISNYNTRFSVLQNIVQELLQKGWFGKALEIARTIIDHSERSFFLKQIGLKLLLKGQIEKALEIARTIIDSYHQSFLLNEIAQEFLKKGQIEKALEITRTIIGSYYPSFLLKDIGMELLKKGQIEKALEIARTIDDFYNRPYLFKELALNFLNKGEIKKALKLADKVATCTMFAPYNQYINLKAISMKLIELDYIKEALEIAYKINHYSYQMDVLKEISKKVVEKEKWDVKKSLKINITPSRLKILKNFVLKITRRFFKKKYKSIKNACLLFLSRLKVMRMNKSRS
jgi:tetratricopeptide (TPR) repeat protein